MADYLDDLKGAIDALRAVVKEDGLGAAGSPPGPCFDIAKNALDKIGVDHTRPLISPAMCPLTEGETMDSNKPCRESEVSSSLSFLGTTLGDLQGAVGKLIDRLEPVLRPETPGPTTRDPEAKNPARSSVELAKRIDEKALSVQDIERKIRNLLEHLEV
jgi:hypothetical protein